MRIDLSLKPTPVQFLKRLSEEYGFNIYVKRDDLTELVGSGNKIRKLEYLLWEALKKEQQLSSPVEVFSRTMPEQRHTFRENTV